ncbi:MAG: hypothetical protein A3I61_06490 [Acidobacteria bacterium RIFCSPLOWO2_02_FULL_68_18]|nr:MAG: hypothetical protein A3I61_06490 [Acidobacteria bacterium RIFCSPLOWO2_02_FULL_68_18]OFW50303.1 MAG: hypothetical protein A3G77_07485 [Acidobacteria bacterium RIFCSPLOWO2_12_FULL_68_19]
MRIARTLFAAAAIAASLAAGVSAQVPPAASAPPQAPPPAGAPPQPQQPAGSTAPPIVPAPTVPAPVAPAGARTFLAPTGMILNAVRAERVVDFELVIGYLQAALVKSAGAQLRAQGEGWRMFKATEPGPNNTVLYVFLLDPARPGADYALGPILSDAYPDQIEQIWKLYQGALAGPGSQSLLNLTPVEPPPLPPAGAPVPLPGATPPPPAVTPGAPPGGALPPQTPSGPPELPPAVQ